MVRSPVPTQSDVLRERASHVPWRRAFGDIIRGIAGRGPMALPDRLEGALYGQLLATGSEPAGDPETLLDLVDALLTRRDVRRPEIAAAELALAPGLVLRNAPASALAEAAADVASGASGDASVAASGVLYALLVMRLLGGERNRRAALSRARREAAAHGSDGVRTVLREGDPWVILSAWRAFERSRDLDGALARAADLRVSQPVAAAITGGLAGAYWGSSRLSGSQRRQVPAGARARTIVDRLIETDDPGGDDRGWQTSTSVPQAVHGIDLTDAEPAIAGSIGIAPLPGRRYVAYHTGAHWRDLDTDARRLRDLGTDLLFLLVEDRELARCRVGDIEPVLRDHDIDLMRYPIRDPLVPRDRDAFRACVADVLEAARRGQGVAVTCRGGFDRAGMTAACLLREAGLGASSAIDRVQRARPGALTLPDQQAYVRSWPTP